MTGRLDLLTRGQKNWVEALLLAMSPSDDILTPSDDIMRKNKRMLERIQSVLLNKKVRVK